MKKQFILMAAAAMVAALSACGGKEAQQAEAAAETAPEVTETTDAAPQTASWMPDSVTVTESGLGIVIENPGDDTRAQMTTPVTLHYRGRLPNGEVFDSSYDRNMPATFSPNQVIAGFGEGIRMLGKGGKATLYIPYELGYGTMGTPGGPIGPNQNLIFDIEIIDFPQN